MSKNWHKRGKIIEACVAEEGSNNSFIIEIENGNKTLRHKSHLRHTKMDKSERKVRFAPDVEINVMESSESECIKVQERAHRPHTRAWPAKHRVIQAEYTTGCHLQGDRGKQDGYFLGSKRCKIYSGGNG